MAKQFHVYSSKCRCVDCKWVRERFADEAAEAKAEAKAERAAENKLERERGGPR